MEIRELSRSEYPPQLLEIPDVPETLWTRGSWPKEDVTYMAVVGSRAQTPYGKEVCEYLIAGLSGYPISIVSGLALGTDACAHQAALDAGLHTIAIPGSGLDDSVLYPRTNLTLAQDILSSGGLLLSENPPLHKPFLKEFPSRNRLMAGLCQAVLVIEAGPKSGTLITCRMASDYNRDLLVVPHRVNDPTSEASSMYLRLGAIPITKPEDIREALHLA